MNRNFVIRNGRYCLLVVALFFLSMSASSNAATLSQREVKVGLYLNNVPTVSLKEKKFQADFNVWFRWRGDDINPVETFKIVNGHIDLKDAVEKKKIGDINYASAHVEATIYRNFDVDRYPLDSQILKIQIESSKADGNVLSFVADKENSNISSKLAVPGYSVGRFESYHSVTSYNTNYGDVSLGPDAVAKFPRFTFSVELKRAGYGFFFKYFSVLFLAAALTFLSFLISAQMLDTRYWLVTSSFFLAVVTGSSLASSLPETESFGLGHMLYNLTMAFIFIAAAAMIHSHKTFGLSDTRAHRLSRIWGLGLTGAYVVLAALVVLVLSRPGSS